MLFLRHKYETLSVILLAGLACLLNANQLIFTLVSFLTYFILSSMLAFIGILSGPMAKHFGQPITYLLKELTWLTGGILIGALIALFIFDWVYLKRIFITN